MGRCTFLAGGVGPRCCVELLEGELEHAGPHRFKCAGAACPGLVWPASVMPHPRCCIGDDGRAFNVADRVEGE